MFFPAKKLPYFAVVNPLKKLLGQTAVYGVSTVLGRALNFLLVPFYTAVFLPEEYGIVSYLYTYVAFFNIIYLFGMETAYFRYGLKHGEEKAYQQAITVILLIASIFTVVLFGFSDQIAISLNIAGKADYIVMLALLMGVDAIAAIPLARLRYLNKAKKFAIVRIVNIFVNIGLNLFFLVLSRDIYNGDYLNGLRDIVLLYYNPDFGIGYVFLSNLLANILFFPMLWRSFAAIRLRWYSELAPKMLKYAGPLVIVGSAGMFNELIDRILLMEWLPEDRYPDKSNEAVVGIYSACYKLSIFITLVIQAFRFAAEPFFFNQSKEQDSRKTFADVLKWFTIFTGLMVVTISLFREPLGQLILRNDAYREGLFIVPVLLMANAFLGMYYNLTVWYKLSDKTMMGGVISVIGALLTLGFNILLIPVLGYAGSALTTLIAYFAMAVISYLLGRKYYPIPYQIGRISAYLLLVSLISAVSYFSWFTTIGWGVAAVEGLLILIYIAVVYYVERKELPAKLRIFHKFTS